MVKKVVVITECRRFRFNFGETLQAVALNKVISKLGYVCITASYENQKNNYNWWFKSHIRKYGIRGLKFELFRIKNIKYPVWRSDKKEEFQQLLEDANAVVCGSDCVWYEKDYNSIFFLNFPKIKIPKIAYAPSLRDDIVSDPIYNNKVARWTKDFSSLSTREKAGSKIIEEISGKKVETVLDPTFLISEKEWSRMSSRRLIKKSYVVMYIIGKSMCMESIISQIESVYPGRKMIWITMENNDGYPVGNGILNIGPAEFISLIRYADAVVTDSFHGTAFSIIFEKQFYAIKRIIDEKDVYDHDCRIKNILEILGINNYFFSNAKIDIANRWIDYSCIKKKLISEKKKSIRYLTNALKNI